MTARDPRITLARFDLADDRLQGLVRADRFAAARPMTCRLAAADIRKAPDAEARLEDQLQFGELFDVLEVKGGWAWGQARRDGYVGFVPEAALAPAGPRPSHRVRALAAFGFSEPDLKSPPVTLLSVNALVCAGAVDGRFVNAGEAGWIFAAALSPIGEFEADPAAVAERFIGSPYLWGGRTRLGLDCSGLVQQAFYACGRGCPRDADQQMAAFTGAADPAALERGDLVFWPGHVAMMVDGARMIHSDAHHMCVGVEPLAEAIARIEAGGSGPPIGFRRP